ncbi:MAG: hypothetical protein ACRYG8_25165 [Janthinobacterium lividum]
MVSMPGFFVHAAWVLALTGITGGMFYWLMSRLLAASAEPPDVAKPQPHGLPADREN